MELEQDPIRREGFFFDQRAFRLSLYRLACAFFASSEFARLGRASDTEPLTVLVAENEEAEICRLLVNVAATVRIVQDRDAGHGSALNSPCGTLNFGLSEVDSPEPLTLREACNKIIHADRFNFDVKPLPSTERHLPNPTYILRPVLHLYGKQHQSQWKVELEVVEFIRHASVLVRG